MHGLVVAQIMAAIRAVTPMGRVIHRVAGRGPPGAGAFPRVLRLCSSDSSVARPSATATAVCRRSPYRRLRHSQTAPQRRLGTCWRRGRAPLLCVFQSLPARPAADEDAPHTCGSLGTNAPVALATASAIRPAPGAKTSIARTWTWTCRREPLWGTPEGCPKGHRGDEELRQMTSFTTS